MGNPRICVVTGSRAEYGLMHDIMKVIQSESGVDLQVVVTGMHLSPEFGLTYQAIEADGFDIAAQVESLLSSDTPIGVTKSMGLGLIGFADTFQRLSPQMVVVLGDRFEIFAPVLAAYMARIPIAHIGGGDVTEGALDESIRHSLTKFSSLHFVTNELSRRRVCQLGEDPTTVFNVGHPGIDRIRKLKLLARDELEKTLGFEFQSKNLLVTYHPVTWGSRESGEEFLELLEALHRLGQGTGILFTKPNADAEGRLLAGMVDDFVSTHPNAKAYTSMGQLKYFSTVRCVDAVVGNSSSGVCEVPSLHKPTVDVGDRQKGRLRGDTVVHCDAVSDAIFEAIEVALKLDCRNAVNPYGDGSSSQRILKELLRNAQQVTKTPKRFYEVTR